MKIASSTVNMAAESSSVQYTSRFSSLQYWVGPRNSAVRHVSINVDPDKADLSALARKLSRQAMEDQALEREKAEAEAAGKAQEQPAVPGGGGLADKDKQKIQIIDDFIYRLTGKHLKVFYLDEESLKKRSSQKSLAVAEPRPVQGSAGYGLSYQYSEVHVQQQAMSFSANGTVRTEDGRTIDFSVTLNMSSEFRSGTQISVKAGDAKIDPLVVNLSVGAPQLSQRDFLFDLDQDGDEEQISRLMAGSGFLALDRNGDGVINDGGELFGPTMGNGFEELRAYDADGNSWIDENDAIYDRLRIWMDDGQGSMQLLALGQAGVGALYLGNVASPFDIRDAGNNTLGTVQSTGVFLREDGGVGTIQHIDLTV